MSSFPDAFEVHVGSWGEEEALAEYHPRVTGENCSLCAAIAKHLGGGSGDPDAPLAA